MGHRKTLEEMKYWKDMWHQAYANIPWRQYKQKRECWIPFDKLINIDLFARLNANGNLYSDPINGKRRRRVIIKSTQSYHPSHLLNTLLNLSMRFGSKRIFRGMYEGTRLRNPIQRAKLVALAKDDSLYWEFIKNTGTDHLFSKEKIETEEWVLNPKRKKART